MLHATLKEREPGLVMCVLWRVCRRTGGPVGCSAPRSPIHEVDAVLAGGRATATTNSCTGNRDKAPRGSARNFWS